MEVEKSLPEDADGSGVIIIVQENDSQITQLWNLGTGEKKHLTERGDGFKVSPDGKWLAYWEGSDNPDIPDGWLKVSDNLGIPKVGIPWEEKWGGLWRGIAGWLDNQHIILRNQLIEGDPYSPSLAKIIINPFTKQQDNLDTDFPDLFFLYPFPDWQGWGIAMYDISLSRVVYEGNYELILLDVKNHQVITRIDHVRPFDSYPLWSPNGQEFVFSNPSDVKTTSSTLTNDELFRVNKDGQVEQLTNLSSYYTNANIQFYQWSPDGRLIAFWLGANNKYNQAELAVLDIKSRKVINYCIPNTMVGYPESLPIWSPDSRQLLVTTYKENNSSQSILIDLFDEWSAKIAEDATVKGWMLSP